MQRRRKASGRLRSWLLVKIRIGYNSRFAEIVQSVSRTTNSSRSVSARMSFGKSRGALSISSINTTDRVAAVCACARSGERYELITDGEFEKRIAFPSAAYRRYLLGLF